MTLFDPSCSIRSIEWLMGDRGKTISTPTPSAALVIARRHKIVERPKARIVTPRATPIAPSRSHCCGLIKHNKIIAKTQNISITTMSFHLGKEYYEQAKITPLFAYIPPETLGEFGGKDISRRPGLLSLNQSKLLVVENGHSPLGIGAAARMSRPPESLLLGRPPLTLRAPGGRGHLGATSELPSGLPLPNPGSVTPGWTGAETTRRNAG